MDKRPIGVFDSGMGGISLLRNLTRLLPGEDFIYYGDDKNAPYGNRSEDEILSLCRANVEFLMNYDIKALVIACNTATSAAAKALRAEMTIPIIGIEPALKPAELNRTEGEIAVLATNATLRQQKFADLMALYGSHAVPIPCPGIVEFVERGETEGAKLDEFLSGLFRPLAGKNITCAVLGCTHYTFAAGAIGKALGNVPLYDGNEGTARQLRRVLERENLLSGRQKGSVRMFTSSNEESTLSIMRDLYLKPIEL